jgi:hypothetical protein
MTEREKQIYNLGLQKLSELQSQENSGPLSPLQVANEISKTASVEQMRPEDISGKVASLIFDAAYRGDVVKAASLISYLG